MSPSKLNLGVPDAPAAAGQPDRMAVPAILRRGSGLMYYEQAVAALARSVSLGEVAKIRDEASALVQAANIAKDRTFAFEAATIKLRAERKAGAILETMDKARGGRPENRSHDATGKDETGSPEKGEGGGAAGERPGDPTRGAPEPDAVIPDRSVPEAPPPTLRDLGISKSESNRWQAEARVPERDFEAWLAGQHERGEIPTSKGLRQLLKGERRAARERALAEKTRGANAALANLADPAVQAQSKRYNVIYADPPWRFAPWSRDSGLDRAADNHYPTADTEAIAAWPVDGIAAEDAALFVWATAPMLKAALTVMARWGFDYRTHWIWPKDKPGTGYWNRNRHELLLLGVRGDIPAPVMGTQSESVIEAPRGAHSEKPAEFRAMIETMFPSLLKIELCARAQHEGWDAWGNEVAGPGAGRPASDDQDAGPTAAGTRDAEEEDSRP